MWHVWRVTCVVWRVCVCVTHLNRCKTSFVVVTFFTCRGHGSCFPSHANESMGSSRKGMWTHIPVPAFLFVWQAAKPRTALRNFTSRLSQSGIFFCSQHDDPIHFLESGFDYVWHYWKPYTVFEKYYQGIYFRSNCLGWFACYRTQFLTDLFKDPFLSSVIPMVTPTRCHRTTGGNPFVGDCGQTWLPNLHTLIC